MAQFRRIRSCLGVTQREIADAIGCTQNNVSYYERGQTIPPDVASRLITYAQTLGVELTFDHIYGSKPLPDPRVLAHRED